MTQLSALNVEMRGDASKLTAEVNKAEASLKRLGTTAKVASAGLSNTQRASLPMASSLSRLSNMSGQARGRIQNLGYQVADIAVQLDMGTKASTVFAQQGSQILSIFGPMGAVLGAVAAVSLPLLGAAFATSATEVAGLTKAIAEVRTETSRYQSEIRSISLGIKTQEELMIYDKIVALRREEVKEAKRVAWYSEGLQKSQSRRLNALRGEISILEAQYKQIQATREEHARVEQYVRETTDAERLLGEQMAAAARHAALLAHEANKVKVAAMAAASEWAKMMAVASRFRDEDDLMSQSLTPSVQRGPKKAAGGNGGGASGGGGGATVNPLIADLDAIRQSLLSQEQAQMDSFARQQETLRAALEQKLLTQQEYAALMESAQQQHSEKMAGIDVYRYGTGLAKANEFFGSMATAMQGGNKKMLKIAKAFGVAQALISTYTGAAEALKLPFPSNLAAFAKVMATGLGAVSQIKGVSSGGGGGAGGGAVGAAGAPEASQLFRVQGIDRDKLYSGDMIKGLFDSIVEESKDRGVRFIVT